jgi:hypothetical protein
VEDSPCPSSVFSLPEQTIAKTDLIAAGIRFFPFKQQSRLVRRRTDQTSNHPTLLDGIFDLSILFSRSHWSLMVATFKYPNIYTSSIAGDHMKKTTIEEIRAMPYIHSTIRKSEDGTFLIHRTTITHIKPVAYYEAVLSGKIKEEDLLEV